MKHLLVVLSLCLAISKFSNAQVSAGDKQDVCASEAVLDATPIAGGYWTLLGGSGEFENSTAHNTKVTGLIRGLNLFRWNYLEGGSPASADVAIYNNLPSIATISLDQKEICEDSWTVVANIISIGTGLWSAHSGSGDFEQPTNHYSKVIVGKGTNVYRWTTSNKGCSTHDDITVINNSVGAQAQEVIKVCGETANLQAVAPSVGSGYWTKIGGTGIIANSTSATSSVSNLNIGTSTFRWTTVNGICSDDTDSYIINQKQKAEVNSSLNTTCDGNVTVTASQAPDEYSKVWSFVRGSGTIVDQGEFFTEIKDLELGENEIKWEVKIENCANSATVVVANSTVSADAGDNIPICQGSTTLTANELTNGETGKWTVYTGGGDIANDVSHVTDVTNIPLQSNIYRWIVTSADGVCSATSDVEVYNSKFEVSAGSDQKVCGSTALLEGDFLRYATGKWDVISGNAAFNNPSIAGATVKELANGVNELRWTVRSAGCHATNTVKITNYNYPAVAQDDESICGDSYLLKANDPSPGTGKWERISGSGTIENMNAAETNVTGIGLGESKFTWTIDVEGCVKSDEVVIWNNTIVANAGKSKSICSNTAPLAGNIIEGARGHWSSSSGDVVFSISTNSNTIGEFPKGKSKVAWNISFKNCTATDEITITNNAFDISAGADVYTDDPESRIEAQALEAGQTGSWRLVSGTGTVVSPNSAATALEDLQIGVNEFVWTVDNGVCEMIDKVKVTYTAFSADAGLDQNICALETDLRANSPGTGVGKWTILEGEAVIHSENEPNSKISGIKRGKVVLQWSITQNGYSAFDTVVISNRTFDVTVGNNIVSCSNEVPLSGQVLGDGYVGEWSVESGTGVFEMKNDPSTLVTGLSSGKNEFRWTVTNEEGCKGSDVMAVVVNDAPKVEFHVNTDIGCSPLSVLFTNVSDNSLQYEWNFGDGSTSIESDPVHSFTCDDEAMEYEVKLTAIAANLCKGSATHKIKVSPNFELNFELSKTEARIPFTEIDAVVTKGRNLKYYRWKMGDGRAFSDVEEVTHEYDEVGEYNISLTARNEFNCEQKMEKVFTALAPLPVVEFEPLPAGGCAPLEVQLFNKTEYADAYEWDFGDGTRSIKKNPTKHFDFVGEYPVTLTATNDIGTVTYSQTIYVEKKPTAVFEADRIRVTGPDLPVKFKNGSVGAVKYEWILGDETSSNEFEPSHIYEKTGLYTIIMRASTEHGCTDEEIKRGYISVDVSLGVGDAEKLRLKLFPNPTTDFLFVENVSDITSGVEVLIYNQQGKKLNREVLKAGERQKSIDVSSLAKGSYIAVVKTKNGKQSVNFIKQ